MKIAIKLILLISVFYGCVSAKKEEIIQKDVVVDAAHTSQNSLDWQGVYTGSYACDQCDGIRMVVSLLDTTYTLRIHYLNEDMQSKQCTGKLEWSSNGSVITLLGAKMQPSRFKVGEHRLIPLDLPEDFQDSLKGEKVDLRQLPYELLDVRWELNQLNGKSINVKSGKTQSITFASAEGKYYGFGGCNNFRGEFFAQERLLSFSRLISTKMTCDRSEEEAEMWTTLNKVDAYEIKDGFLSLFEGDKIIARFKKTM